MGLAKRIARTANVPAVRTASNRVLWVKDLPQPVIKTRPTRRIKPRMVYTNFGIPKDKVPFEQKLKQAIAVGGRAVAIPKKDRPRMKKLASLLLE